jgi:hypothetical protein
MTTSLYDLSVGSYLQTVGGVVGVLARGRRHCEESGIDPDSLVGVRLFEDMAPLSFQIVSVAHHSLGVVKALNVGRFGPPTAKQPTDYAGLEAMAAQTQNELVEIKPDDINAFSGKDFAFEMGEVKIPFTVENFILSFSIPNLHFHATTAYDILRMKGVPLGKRNYLGALRTKT